MGFWPRLPSLSLSLHFLNIRIHGIWRHVPEMELSRCIWRSEKQFLQKPINAPDACLYFPLVRILFEIKMKNCEYSVSIYFSSAISLSLSSLWNTNIKEYLKKKKETFFHFLRSFIKKFYSLQFPITEFVRLRIS